ncbi:sarcalumenin [Maniola hyperantus]|uniref:sarcalumenin n=1 Tax=Aphantopus hyperantus TaxID=2795564 RepID=UPI0015681E68|nr:sarcalumenin [Maniola hyperantus]XP_034836036.1 sarcalumenin [Maniola hyperantus]XP_034836037.1 sarcalumenin [Maniola hyperantus]XP_034836038.1 sarcalumenin [Maniola hyperantus]
MWTKRSKLWRFMLCMLFAVSALALAARADDDIPSESQCRPYIEKALKELESGDSETESTERNESSEASVDVDTKEENSAEEGATAEADSTEDGDSQEDAPSVEVADEPYMSQVSYEDEGSPADAESKEDATTEETDDSAEKQADDSKEDDGDSKEDASADEQETEKESGEVADEADSKEDSEDSKEDGQDSQEEAQDSQEDGQTKEDSSEDGAESKEGKESEEQEGGDTAKSEAVTDADQSEKATDASEETDAAKAEGESDEDTKTEEDDGSQEKAESDEVEGGSEQTSDSQEEKDNEESEESIKEGEEKSDEEKEESSEKDESVEGDTAEDKSEEKDEGAEETSSEDDVKEASEEDSEKSEETGSEEGEESEEEGAPEEDLLLTLEIPENLRSRDHIIQILRLDEDASEAELIIEKSADIVLRDLKRLYENSIKPLEVLYRYRDLSNRHFGDPEIFSKPLVLFMGPWSGGKSSILNYLTGLEFTEWSLRTGAEPSPAYFNILMHGKDPQVLDGTQLAADWTFSGLQKFGQGLEERLRGLRYPSKLLEKVNIVEIPGILEVRKQVSRVFPFNDACQWFIDRADIIFLVYDPSKLDVGPETEAILDQLKGRESQTRIVLNKADSVKPEELMRVQSALIWNISPLMSSPQPPVMYTVSLWSLPYEPGAPIRLLQAQERELLRDLRQAIDRRIENKISSARRFAVRVRNHAKMVDCYLTTYYNHKTIFGNKKVIADAIIENPQNYHIYEGLSTLTNISRYDLPDPETYRDFFRLNPLYEFQQLSATCTYFRGCPITRLDVAIAYDFPELVGKYKKMVETATPQGMPKS